jgi:hypothetical protein
MWLARYFPGLTIDEATLSAMTPEQTRAMRKAGARLLKAEGEERFAHTKLIATASGARIR